jgi:replicative DNA helicase
MAEPRDPNRFKPRVQAVDIAGRVPPHNNDAEAAVMSAILTETKAFDLVAEVLPNSDPFYIDAHRRIYDVALELHREGAPVDIQTVAEVLRRTDKLQAIGGLAYMARLVDATPAVAHVAAHAKIILDTYRIRQLIETCQMVAAEGYGDYGNAQEFIDGAEQRIYKLAHTKDRNSPILAYDAIKTSFQRYEEAAARGRRVTGVPTGFYELDTLTSGMHDGELIIVAARPGMGKTAYVMNMALNVVSPKMIQDPDGEVTPDPDQETFGCVVFSLEMPTHQLSDRVMCSEARVNLSSFRAGMVQGDSWDRLVESANRVSQLPIWFDDTTSLSVLDIRSRVRRIQAEYNRPDPAKEGRFTQRIGLIVIDYIQLMGISAGSRAGNREQEIAEISRGLKNLAKELRVPVVALSQLNRSVETRGKDKRPQLADLRESGAIEQDADMVQFIYRPDYYIQDKQSPESLKVRGLAEVNVAKQRNGPTGRVRLKFFDDYVRFDNPAKGETLPDNYDD